MTWAITEGTMLARWIILSFNISLSVKVCRCCWTILQQMWKGAVYANLRGSEFLKMNKRCPCALTGILLDFSTAFRRVQIYHAKTLSTLSTGCQSDTSLWPVRSSVCKHCPSPLCLFTPWLPHLALGKDLLFHSARQIKTNGSSQLKCPLT